MFTAHGSEHALAGFMAIIDAVMFLRQGPRRRAALPEVRALSVKPSLAKRIRKQLQTQYSHAVWRAAQIFAMAAHVNCLGCGAHDRMRAEAACPCSRMHKLMKDSYPGLFWD